MQTPRFDPMPDFVKDEIAASLRDMIADPELGVEITYKRFSSQTVDIEAGTATRTEPKNTIQALRRIVGVEEAERSGGRLQMGDRIYQIMKDDLSGTPTTSDRVQEGSVTREVVDWVRDVMDLFYLVTVRGGDAQ